MGNTVIQVSDLSKQYRLGQIGTGSLAHDVNRWWYRIRGKEDPYLKVGEENDRTQLGTSEYVWALRNLNFEVNRGDVLGVIGRNGAGKSTLLKILSRTTAPTKGSVKIKGRVASLLEVGTGFHPELTGRENIFLNGAILGMTKNEIKRKFDEIVDFAGVERYIDTPVKRYSSGMYVRLAFGVAAHLESEILIVDEVLAVGDAEFQQKCLGKMKDVSVNEGRTVLFVSHNMAAVSTLCTVGMLMQNGMIKETGAIKNIIDKYITNGKVLDGEVFENEIVVSKQNKTLKFKKVSLVGKNGTGKDFGLNETVTCEIEFEVLKDDSKAFVSIHLLDKYNSCVLASFNADSVNLGKDPLFNQPLKKGIYKVKCTLPENFLNDSKYSISAFLSADINWRDMTIAEDVISFQMHDTGEMRKEHTTEWIGVVRPKLTWYTQQIS